MKAEPKMVLAEYCVKDAILADLEAADKEDALRQLVEALAAAKAFPKTKRKVVADEIIDRERQATTGIGSGVGVPHARSEHVKQIVLAIARIPGGIDYGAVDGERVRVMLLLISPKAEHEAHLAAMKSIVQIVRDSYQCKRLLGCSTSESFVDLLAELAQ
ncbi:MAG: PTS sugar transporter subunit IIA [Planctomycetota bacterium]|jgi:mannitol/fructose-specific phosphotransferase system IIA component (Ntr-type)